MHVGARLYKRIAWATSLAVHLVAAWVLAGWSAPTLPHATFAGRRQAIQLQLTTDPVVEPPEPAIEVARHVEQSVVIEPGEARLEQRRYRVELREPAGLPETLSPEIDLARAELDRRSSRPEAAPAPAMPRPQTAHAERSATRPPQLATRAQPPEVPGTDPTRPPTFAGNPPPRYPEAARQRGWQGTVLLKLNVNEAGEVARVEVARSSGYPVLDGAAVIAVRRWRGTPATRNGQPVATVEYLPIQFRLPAAR